MYVLLEVTLKVLYGFVGLCCCSCLFCRNVPCNSGISCLYYVYLRFSFGCCREKAKKQHSPSATI